GTLYIRFVHNSTDSVPIHDKSHFYNYYKSLSPCFIRHKFVETLKQIIMSNTVSNQNDIFSKYESQRYGIMSMLLLIVGCSAGIAVGVGALTQVFSLAVLAITTMAALSMMLAIAPLKY